MKKIITFMMVIALAISSQAATFAWGTGTVKVQFDGAIIEDGSATGYLVYLGNESTAADWTFDTTLSGADAITNDKVGNKTSTTGTPPFLNANGPIAGVFDEEDTKYDIGSHFGMFITYTDSNGDMWYNIASVPYAYATDNANVGIPAEFNFSWEKNTGSLDKTAVGAGWTPVPEPATAALAIAGLAMLIKRRK